MSPTTDSQAENQEQLDQHLTQIEDKLNTLVERQLIALWNCYLGIENGFPDSGEPDTAALLLGPSCEKVLSLGVTNSVDPVLAQRIRVLRREILKTKVDALPEVVDLRQRVCTHLNNLRPQSTGKVVSRLTLANILRYEEDCRLRREAWLALHPLHQKLESIVAVLMHRRNHYAQAAGFDDAMDWMWFVFQDMERDTGKYLLGELEQRSSAPYQHLLSRCRAALNVDNLHPWDLSYALEIAFPVPDVAWQTNQLIAYCETLSRSLGFPGDSGIHVCFQPLPFLGMCFPVAPPHDVRLLIAPSNGWTAYAGVLHEWGHALHARHVGQPSYVVARGEPSCLMEGLAHLFFLLGTESDWLSEMGNLSVDDAQAIAAHQRARRLLRLRQLLANAHFERAAYAALDPASPLEYSKPSRAALTELHHIWREAQERLMMLDCEDDPGWAAQSAFALYPGYWVTHLLAEMIASQAHLGLQELYIGTTVRSEIAEILIDQYYAFGGAVCWQRKIRSATGAALSMESLLAELSDRCT